MRLDQGDQALPRHNLFHLDQEQLLAGLLALGGVLGVGEGHLLHRETQRVESGHFARIRRSSSDGMDASPRQRADYITSASIEGHHCSASECQSEACEQASLKQEDPP